MPRAFGYIRQVRIPDAETVEAQRQSILDYFESRLKPKGIAWGGIYEDLAISGKKELRTRLGGLALDLELYADDCVIITNLLPMFNSTRALREITERWNERGIHLHILGLGMDTSTPIGKWMQAFLVKSADLRRTNNSEQMKHSIAHRRSLGRPTSGKAPFGFKIAGRSPNKKYVPDPASREIGKWVVKWRFAGKTWETLYWHLIRMGTHRKNGKEWGITQLRNMFKGECRLLHREPGGSALLAQWQKEVRELYEARLAKYEAQRSIRK
jgi:DNA invertase Pin-like site-specific DNA recombinase